MNNIKSNRILSIIILVIALTVSGLCIFSINTTRREIANMEQIVNSNIQENVYLDNFEEASDYLSAQAREYIRTYKPIYMEKYFEELESFKRRENAIERFKESGATEIEIILLESALEKSNELVEREVHAMAIVSKLIRYDEERLPQQIRDYEFTLIEKQSDINTLKSRASNLVYGSAYEDEKEEIAAYIDRVSELIRMNTNQESTSAVSSTYNAITMLNTYVIILIIVIVLTFIYAIIATAKVAKEYKK